MLNSIASPVCLVRTVPFISFVACLCPWPPAVAGEASAAGPALPPIVVTATRDARSAHEVPAATGALSAKQMRMERAVRTIPETLKHEPGTMVQKTAHGQGSPFVRGFTAYRNLFLIDGVRLNNSVFRDGPNQYWNTVDPLGLRRVELVRGPFSVLYGSDAVGGTLSAITRGVEDLRVDSDWDRTLYYRTSTAERSHIARVETIGRLLDELVLSLGYSFKDFGDLRGGRRVGTQKKTGYNEFDWDAKLEYFLDDDSFLVLAHQSVDLRDAWRTHRTIYGIDWEGLTVGTELQRILDQDRDLTYLQYHSYNGDGFAEEIHAGVSHQAQSEEQDRVRTGGLHDVQGFDVNTVGAFLSLKTLTGLGTLVYGTEFYHDEVDSFRRNLNPDGSLASTAIQGPVGDDATYDTVGLYIQDEIEASDHITLILGARYEYVEADANRVQDPVSGQQTSISDDWSDLAVSGRALLDLVEDGTWRAFAGISEGFRAPNMSDLSRLDTARTDEIETPSSDLEPEEYITCEAGLKASSSVLSGQLAYFYTDIDGMIVRTPTGRIIGENHEVTKFNSGNGHIHGVELDACYRVVERVALFGTFTWMDGELDTYPTSEAREVTEPVSRLMPPKGRAGVRCDLDGGLWVESACTIVAEADDLTTRDRADTSRIPPGGTPGYTVYDARAGWRLSDALTVSLALENLTDEDYRVHGSGVNEPGRNMIMTVTSTF